MGEGGVQQGLAGSVGVQATGLPAVEPPGGGSKVALNGRAITPERGVMGGTGETGRLFISKPRARFFTAKKGF